MKRFLYRYARHSMQRLHCWGEVCYTKMSSDAMLQKRLRENHMDLARQQYLNTSVQHSHVHSIQ
jgi:hypothetical protein